MRDKRLSGRRNADVNANATYVPFGVNGVPLAVTDKHGGPETDQGVRSLLAEIVAELHSTISDGERQVVPEHGGSLVLEKDQTGRLVGLEPQLEFVSELLWLQCERY